MNFSRHRREERRKKKVETGEEVGSTDRDVASLKVMGEEGTNFENLLTRICVRIRRVRCEWWQLKAAQKGDRNDLPIRANVFFMTVKNLQNFGFSIFQYFLLHFALNEDTNLFLWIFWEKKILSNKINLS